MTKKQQKTHNQSKQSLHSWKNQFIYSLMIVSYALVACLSILIAVHSVISQQVRDLIVVEPPISNVPIAPYPHINQVLGVNTVSKTNAAFISDMRHAPIFQDISAQSAIILDDDSKVVLFSKNANFRFSMASTTKIMTALVALDYYAPDAVLTVPSDKMTGALVGLQPGQQFRFEDLLYGMLLPSGNDAALTIAKNYPGGQMAFVEKMNQKATEYQLFNTHFADSVGLADEGDYTTVRELALLASIARKKPAFAQVVSTKEKIISTVDGKNTYYLFNLNKLLGTYGVTGIKTGFTDEAGEVLVTSQQQDGHTLIIVVMKSLDRFLDTEKILTQLGGAISYVNFDANH